jgi:hypothetical protein
MWRPFLTTFLQFVLNNSHPGQSVHAAMNNTIAFWHTQCDSISAAGVATMTAMFAAMVAFGVALTLLVIAPVLRLVDRGRFALSAS